MPTPSPKALAPHSPPLLIPAENGTYQRRSYKAGYEAGYTAARFQYGAAGGEQFPFLVALNGNAPLIDLLAMAYGATATPEPWVDSHDVTPFERANLTLYRVTWRPAEPTTSERHQP